MSMSKTLKRVMIARTTLLLDQPFFGVLALALIVVEDATCATAWTDGKHLGFNPAFVDSLSNDELLGVIAHEVMHCACGHPWRRDAREPRQWNVAADLAINPIIKEAGLKLPQGCLYEKQYEGKSAEWIYARIPPQPQSKSGGNGQGNDPSGTGEVRDAQPGTGDNKGDQPGDQPGAGGHNPTEADWQQQVQTAIKAAGQGRLPASVREKVQAATRSRADWRSLLRRYVQEVVRTDYSWQRPNVRYIPSGLYLPALRAHACGRIVVAVDTSGSIDSVLLGQFAAEIRTIADEVQPSAIDVVYCDARVHRVDHFERGDVITLDAIGRGGTSFVPVFEWVEQDGESPAVLIYLTDLYGTFPDHGPEYPVIWAAYSTSVDSVPFGDLVPCE